jgi:hypothetical protein
MDIFDLPKINERKYNKWCEKAPIVNEDTDKWDKADEYSKRTDLTPCEKSAFYLHEHTDCEGYEFVAFSNIEIKRYVILSNNVILVPCFLTDMSNKSGDDPLLQPTLKMMHNARFIYDGWIPITEWNDDNVRAAIRQIDEALSIFCLLGRSYVKWEPKYPADPKSFNLYHDFHFDELDQIVKLVDKLEPDDQIAVYRSIGWISKGIQLDDPIVRFLFSILAIESLAMYIERGASNQSAFVALKTEILKKEDLLQARDKCIDEIISTYYQNDKTKAIIDAYFECVVSLTKILKNHIRNMFDPDTNPFKLLFGDKVDDASLYDFRHEIAHGCADVLSDIKREQIRKRVWHAEALARRYIIKVLEKAFAINLKMSNGMYAASFTPLNGVMNRKSFYSGSVHMAMLY